ncbi:MAG TPA: TorF family putative porin [Gammaproteobacteria bacterium]
MKNVHQKLLASVFAASALAVSAFVPAAYAEVSASAGASNMYYWRGLDLGAGDAAVWGDLKASNEAGLYGGVWMSSGDILQGTEYDLYFGYGTEIGGFGFDISYWSYNYPSLEVAPGDFAEVVLGVSYGPFAFNYYDNIAISEDHFGPGADYGSEDYSYYTLAFSQDAWTFKYGEHEDAEGLDLNGYSHFDITYAYNDNVSFTLGNPIDEGDGGLNEEPKFIVNFTFPIK